MSEIRDSFHEKVMQFPNNFLQLVLFDSDIVG
jgi:hypothetical protein